MKNEKGQFVKRHGMSFSSEYRSWISMKQRCTRPDENHQSYKDVNICDDWMYSFDNFIRDMGIKPDPSYTIDRISNDLGYSKDNCRWATRRQQNRNYSLNRIIEFNGKKMCVTEWAEMLNIPRHRIYQRLNKGWSIEKALTHKS